MKPILACVGWVVGLAVSTGIFLAADHLAHHQDALGFPAEIVLIVSLALLGAFVGAGAADE